MKSYPNRRVRVKSIDHVLEQIKELRGSGGVENLMLSPPAYNASKEHLPGPGESLPDVQEVEGILYMKWTSSLLDYTARICGIDPKRGRVIVRGVEIDDETYLKRKHYLQWRARTGPYF